MARSKKNQITREMFTLARYAWHDGSQICLKIRSIKGEASNDYTVNLYNDEQHIDTCTCPGFLRYGHCCHVDHYRLVEGLQADRKLAIEALMTRINAKAGRQIIGYATAAKTAEAASDAVLQQTEQVHQEVGAGSSLVGNRYILPPRHDNPPAPIAVDRAWLLGVA